MAAIVHKEAQRLYRLTMDLLDLSRLEAGRLTLVTRLVDVTELLDEMSHRYETLHPRENIRFVVSIGHGPLFVIGDHDRLNQLFTNLLDNAFKFCRPGGEVSLAATQDAAHVCVVVANTAEPIPDAQLPFLFDRFYRGDHSRAEKTGGSGVGLAIVRELAHVHGGDVVVHNADHQVVFTVTLPHPDRSPFTKALQQPT